jgi:hypothetical protein
MRQNDVESPSPAIILRRTGDSGKRGLAKLLDFSIQVERGNEWIGDRRECW